MTGDNKERYTSTSLNRAGQSSTLGHSFQAGLWRTAEGIWEGDNPRGLAPRGPPETFVFELLGKKFICCFLCSSFICFPYHALVFLCPLLLALALSPHCTPFPLHLPGWWCWVPGVVTVRSGVVIDREAFSPPVLELLLLAEDIGLLNGTADLFVTILDDNDNWPTFSPAALTIHLLENCPPGKLGIGPRPQLPGGSRLEAEFTFSGEDR